MIAARTAGKQYVRGRPFTPGDRRINRKGRPRGSKDRVPRLVEAILDVCLRPISRTDRRNYLEWLAQEHPKVFARLIGKLLTTTKETATATEIVCMFPAPAPERRAAVPRRPRAPAWPRRGAAAVTAATPGATSGRSGIVAMAKTCGNSGQGEKRQTAQFYTQRGRKKDLEGQCRVILGERKGTSHLPARLPGRPAVQSVGGVGRPLATVHGPCRATPHRAAGAGARSL